MKVYIEAAKALCRFSLQIPGFFKVEVSTVVSTRQSEILIFVQQTAFVVDDHTRIFTNGICLQYNKSDQGRRLE